MPRTPRALPFATIAAAALGVAAVMGALSAQAADGAAPLKQIANIELPGPPGKRFDYLVVDYDDGWLFSAHMGARQTYAIDLRTSHVINTIIDTPGAEGLEYVPDERKVYTSNAYDNTVGVIDLKTMKVARKIPTESKPDGSTYAAPAHKLYVSDERAKAVAVIDVRTDKMLTTIHFDSETGVPLYDSKANLVYVNLQSRDELAAIDPMTDKVVARYPVQGCKGNHGMALDVAHRRAFLACQGNNRLTVFDLDAHQAITSMPLAWGSDVVQFDPGTGRVYVACSTGAIAVFQEIDPGHFRKLENVSVPWGVHSLAVDARTHRVYAPAERDKGRGVARMLVFEAVIAPVTKKP
jgi:YVTN family beta-propeller protein